MKIEYQVIFVPSSDDVRDVSDTREVVFRTGSRLSSRDDIGEKSREYAARDNIIDSYALRNYWDPACCEMRVVETQWDSVSDVSNWLRKRDDVVSVSKVEDSWKHSIVECEFDSEKKRKETEKEIRKKYGKTFPVRSKKQFMQFTMRSKGSINTNSLSETRHIYRKHRSS